jgi:hypothetical protein
MRLLVFAFLLVALALPAQAYDACGDPPERPDLPGEPARATEADALAAQERNRDFALDVGGYLTCTQLAEADVRAEAERGERSQASAEALTETFRAQAADARGRQSGWRDAYAAWMAAWERAHGKPAPPLPPE